MIERLYLLLEIITILLGMHVLHRERKKPTIVTMIYMALALIDAAAIEAGWVPELFVNFIYLGLIFLCVFEYGDKVYDACIYIVMDVVLMGVLQLVSGIIVCAVLQTENAAKEVILLITICACILLILVNRYIKIGNYVEIVFINGIIGKTILFVAALVCFFSLGVLKRENFIPWKDIIGFPLLIIVISVILFQWQKERYQNKQKARELLAYEKYNVIYKDLIGEVRRRQHDFNNHINAVFSMNVMARDLDELVKRQNDYCARLLAENNTNKLLREDISSVLAGFIYTKIGQAEKEGIKVNYTLDMGKVEGKISFVDFVEIFGNLFDNAIEEVSDKELKNIDFSIIQEEYCLLIRISNPCDKEKAEKMQDMFLEGHSSKGKGRGLGLANVNRAVGRYEGKLQVHYINRNGIDYIIFNVILSI